MAKTIGTSDLTEVWGSDRAGQGAPALVTPTLGTIEKGFVAGVASSNDFTWVSNELGQKINHILRNGVAAWNSATAYVTGSVVTRSGGLWIATANNTNSTPAEGNANWARALTALNTQAISIAGPPPVWISNSTVRIPAGARLADDTGTKVMTVTVALDVVLNSSTTGALALDQGTEASNTWYYVWLCEGTSGVTAVFSTSRTSPTLPSGHNAYKRLLPFAVRNDASSNLLAFGPVRNWASGTPFIPWDAETSYWNGSAFVAGTTVVLNNGVATSWTDVSCASFVPPISRSASFRFMHNGTGYFNFRPKGATHNGFGQLGATTMGTADIGLDASQAIQYIRQSGAGGGIYADVTGFWVTEV